MRFVVTAGRDRSTARQKAVPARLRHYLLRHYPRYGVLGAFRSREHTGRGEAEAVYRVGLLMPDGVSEMHIVIPVREVNRRRGRR